MNIQENIRFLNEEIIKLSAETMSPTLAQNISAYFGAKIALESLLGNSIGIDNKNLLLYNKGQENTYVNVSREELFPTLTEFRQNHTEHNLKKLCLEVKEFCISIYSTLQNEEEKNIYKSMFQNL